MAKQVQYDEYGRVKVSNKSHRHRHRRCHRSSREAMVPVQNTQLTRIPNHSIQERISSLGTSSTNRTGWIVARCLLWMGVAFLGAWGVYTFVMLLLKIALVILELVTTVAYIFGFILLITIVLGILSGFTEENRR